MSKSQLWTSEAAEPGGWLSPFLGTHMVSLRHISLQAKHTKFVSTECKWHITFLFFSIITGKWHFWKPRGLICDVIDLYHKQHSLLSVDVVECLCLYLAAHEQCVSNAYVNHLGWVRQNLCVQEGCVCVGGGCDVSQQSQVSHTGVLEFFKKLPESTICCCFYLVCSSVNCHPAI